MDGSGWNVDGKELEGDENFSCHSSQLFGLIVHRGLGRCTEEDAAVEGVNPPRTAAAKTRF